MSIQRYISTSFWSDKWIRELDPSERYLYMYLLTNTETNISGIYKLTIDRMAFDTGYDERTLRPMLRRFEKAGKAFFFEDEYIILPSWPKHQKWEKKETIKKGIDSALKELPERVLSYAAKVGYRYAIIGYTYQPSYSDSDSDSDSEFDSDSDIHAQEARAPAEAPISQNPTSPAFHKMVYDKWSKLDGVPKPPEYITWILSQSYRDYLAATKGYHSGDILGALDNFAKIIGDPGQYWIQGRPSLPKFFAGEIFQACRPGVFPVGALKDQNKTAPVANEERAKFDAELERLIAEEKAQEAKRGNL